MGASRRVSFMMGASSAAPGLALLPVAEAASQQPQGPAAIDWSNPISRGLVAVRYADGRLITRVGDVQAAINGGVVRKVSVAGVGVDSTSGSKRQAANTGITNSDATLFAFVDGGTAAESIAIEFGAASPQFTANVRGLRVNGARLSPYTRNFAAITGTTPINGATPYTIATTYAGSTTRAFLNGALEVSGTTLTSSSSDGQVSIGDTNAATSTFYWRGTIYAAYVWNRALSDAEIASISRNPWQLFRTPAVRPLPIQPPAPNTPSAVEPWLGKRVRTSQPQGAVGIDWGNPIARGLAYLYAPTIDRELVNGLTPTFGSAFAKRSTPGGVGVAPVANSTVTFPSTRLVSSDNITLFALVHVPSLASAGEQIPWAGTGIGVAGSTVIGQQWFGSGNIGWARVYYSPDFNGDVTVESAGSIVTGETALFVATYRRNDALRLFKNGRLLNSTAAGNFAANLKYNNQTIQVGRNLGGSGSVLLSGIAHRAWSDAEIASISQNPWQLFAPLNTTAWVPA